MQYVNTEGRTLVPVMIYLDADVRDAAKEAGICFSKVGRKAIEAELLKILEYE